MRCRCRSCSPVRERRSTARAHSKESEGRVSPAVVLTVSPSLIGGDHGSSTLSRVATQMSWPREPVRCSRRRRCPRSRRSSVRCSTPRDAVPHMRPTRPPRRSLRRRQVPLRASLLLLSGHFAVGAPRNLAGELERELDVVGLEGVTLNCLDELVLVV